MSACSALVDPLTGRHRLEPSCWTDLPWCALLAGPAFEPFATPTFERCERIVAAQLGMQAQTQAVKGQQGGIRFPDMDRDFVISALDLVSGLAEGLGPAVQGLVAASQLRAMVVQCCRVSPADG